MSALSLVALALALLTLLSHDWVKVIPPPLAVTDGSAGATDVGGPS